VRDSRGWALVQEEFEDTKGIIRIRKSEGQTTQSHNVVSIAHL